jgi:hypothetical protein
VLEPATIALLEGGSALIVGTVDAAGMPHASRAWGLVVHPDGERVRVLLGDDDERAVADLRGGGRIAITGADVRTLSSRQVKGRAVGFDEVSAADQARSAVYCDLFFEAVEEVDGTERAILERMRPAGLVACEVVLDCAFDQSPGPKAGAPVAAP